MREYRIESVAQMEMLMPLLNEAWMAGQSVRFSPSGTSMMPMLRQGRDSVVLSPVSSKLKKYDLPLYQRDSGKYVLHRIVATGETYTCLGDNQFQDESGIRQDQIIAVVTAFYRGDTLYSVEHPGYRIYCRLWYHSRFIRCFCRKVLNRLRRSFRKINGYK